MAVLNFKRKNKNEINKQARKKDDGRDFEITPDTIISDILAADEGLFEIFTDAGMLCVMCPLSQSESLEEACDVHGVSAEDMADRLNEFLKQKNINR